MNIKSYLKIKVRFSKQYKLIEFISIPRTGKMSKEFTSYISIRLLLAPAKELEIIVKTSLVYNIKPESNSEILVVNQVGRVVNKIKKMAELYRVKNLKDL